MTFRALRPYIIAVGMTLPGVSIRFLHPDVSPLLVALLSNSGVPAIMLLLTSMVIISKLPFVNVFFLILLLLFYDNLFWLQR